ncbi:glutathione peroxidase [Salinicoccus sediminis]|uniref:Glutathione peroxidase n=1 Tax=Salinicoccus sediminis TaxID=1432562 RepID=A0A0M2SNQ7_9STAP|nr:glutathione peroxidase [Salinicoccus sediminis]KKK35853.1 glutathione peroxidase [Salinicoccus sediminis]
MSIYDYEVTMEDGESYNLKQYEGQPMIIVNTATKCGLSGQFEELEMLYQKYKENGLIILGFPSNQFKQELGSAAESAESCRLTYGVTFPMHQLTVINGKDAAPLFKYLKEQAPGTMGDSIKWNFTKFLVSPDGKRVKRFAPKTSPKDMVTSIEELLKR